ncbi:HIV Tat-specific factor 1-like [Anneissia japonica]|uniref:HIV Tat-specific factor 1-like n=1 Tax=Anneissia japonica TaxID=1529436 RepID=UPI00142567EB|nr:HIV Tat-specific factor 1-like [Anneissia japonica]XP_033112011.1 HIV Tat-specific factor 1-like [Anneissia japonica]
MDGDQTEFERQLQLEKRLSEENASACTYTDPNDGTVFEWDESKRAWFPKVDEDFLAAYHASYGNSTAETPTDTNSAANENTNNEKGVTNTVNNEPEAGGSKVTPATKKRKQTQEQWFEVDEEKNTNVYVSGLPEDITMDEFKELMGKCGIIMVNEETEEQKLKLYKDSDGNLKGDGLCCYLKRESVDLALQLLDESDLRGHKISVEVAKFSQRGEYRPQRKKKKNKKKKKKTQEKLLDWRPEKKLPQRKRNETVVIIKHLFHPNEFDEDATVINEIKDDLTAECSKFGDVKKVLIFDRHAEGVASVKFSNAEDADRCILALNGRWFAKRQLSVSQWDGNTDYKIEETETERETRLQKWDEFLQKDDELPSNTNNKDSAQDDKQENELPTTAVT